MRKLDPNYEYVEDVEVYEMKTYYIEAKNRNDAQKMIESLMQSQDKLESIVSFGRSYDAKVKKFVGREMGKKKG